MPNNSRDLLKAILRTHSAISINIGMAFEKERNSDK